MTKPLVERVLSIVVLPEGGPIFSETATTIEIIDEAAGEFIKVSQSNGRTDSYGAIFFNPDEWPSLRQAIDRMVNECRSADQA